ncbi:MAG: redoxin family protein, partial [bacterium]|nr:redoxin family protein [bacterium]
MDVVELAELVSAVEAPKPEAALGKPLPVFVLEDHAEKEYDLAKLKGKAVVVLAFTSQKCPYSRAGDPRLAALAKHHAERKVVFLSIDSHKDTSPEEIKGYAHKANDTGEKLPYPVLKDAGNRYADAVHAKRTPEIFILDKDLRLVYHGALDNQKKPEDKGYVNYVGQALDELL